MFIHGDSVKCESLGVIRGLWSALSDHVALHAVLRHEERLAVGLPEVELESVSPGRSVFGSAFSIGSLENPGWHGPGIAATGFRCVGLSRRTRIRPSRESAAQQGHACTALGVRVRV